MLVSQLCCLTEAHVASHSVVVAATLGARGRRPHHVYGHDATSSAILETSGNDCGALQPLLFTQTGAVQIGVWVHDLPPLPVFIFTNGNKYAAIIKNRKSFRTK